VITPDDLIKYLFYISFSAIIVLSIADFVFKKKFRGIASFILWISLFLFIYLLSADFVIVPSYKNKNYKNAADDIGEVRHILNTNNRE
jgi:hypothetical protein